MKTDMKKEDAVSPVIGVMLMLVITIIIAAVITGFATDLSKDTSSTPMALMEIDYVDVEEMNGAYVKSFGIVHKGGDAVPLNELQITYVTNAGESIGLLNVLETSQVSVIGKEGANAVVSTGDVIKVVPGDHASNKIIYGSGVAWTVTHAKSKGVIAKGEFIALTM